LSTFHTFRLLVWLRWRIGINTTSARGRWAAAGFSVLFALAMSPVYIGGAIGAYALAVKAGVQALPIVLGVCQLSVFWVSLLIGAMGRTFEMDKLKRYPLRTLDVFAINTLASLGEPVVVMTFPSLISTAFGVARHSGAAAGFGAALAGLLMLFVTASLLQLLLALLDDLLRREWMRYVAAFFFTFTIIGLQLTLRRSSTEFAEQARKAGVTPETLLEQVRTIFERIPTVAAPASAGGAHPAGWLSAPLVGLAACLVLILVPVLLGARVMATAALRASVGTRLVGRGGNGARGSLGPKLPFLTRVQSLLVAREVVYMTRTPALLYQLAVVPLSAFALMFLAPTTKAGPFGAFMPMFVMLGTLAGRNLMLWGYDGPGVRTLFLLPVSPRELVLTKNLGWFASALLEALIVLTTITVLRTAQVLPHLPLVFMGWLAMALTSGVIGTWISARFPKRPPERGLGRRSPGGVAGLGAVFGFFAMAGALIVAVIAVRSLTPDRYDELASVILMSAAAGVAAVVWWIALDRNADVVEQNRERMIDALAKSSDT
jgi:hypothetical protein